MVSPQEGVKAVRLELERLEEHLRPLSPRGWAQPSACSGWEVGDVVAHLAWNASLYIDRVRKGLSGDLAPRPVRPPSNTPQRPLADFVRDRAISYRKELGDELFATFSRTNHEFVTVMEGVKPEEWDRPCPWVAEPVPIRRFVTMRMSEVGIHSWDIRSPVDPRAALYAESLPLLMEASKSTVLRAIQPPAPPQRPARLRWATAGPGAETIDVLIDGGATIEAPGPRADVTAYCTTEVFVLLVYGRAKLQDAVKTQQVRIEGDRALASALPNWFKGV